MDGKNAKTLEESIMSRMDQMDYLISSNKKNENDIQTIYKNLKSTFQKVGLVKYDAFQEMGGKLSFSLALLNETNDGFIINAMHSREGCYTYIKEIIDGNSVITLADEEKEALDIKQKESNYIFNEIDKKLSNIAQLRNTKYKELKIKEDELNKIAKGVSPTKLLQSTLEYIEKITKNEKELHDNLNNKKCDFDEKTKIKSSRDGILSQAKKQLEMKEEILKNLLSKNKFESINLVEKSILPQNIKVSTKVK